MWTHVFLIEQLFPPLLDRPPMILLAPSRLLQFPLPLLLLPLPEPVVTSQWRQRDVSKLRGYYGDAARDPAGVEHSITFVTCG